MKTRLIVSLALLSLILAACGGGAAPSVSEPVIPTLIESQPIAIPTLTPAVPMEIPTASVNVSFANDVKPILAGSCVTCHGGEQVKAGLNMTSYEGLMAGSVNGAVIIAGNAPDSVLIQLVVDGEMPKRGPSLTAEQIQVISDWVTAGALNN